MNQTAKSFNESIGNQTKEYFSDESLFWKWLTLHCHCSQTNIMGSQTRDSALRAPGSEDLRVGDCVQKFNGCGESAFIVCWTIDCVSHKKKMNRQQNTDSTGAGGGEEAPAAGWKREERDDVFLLIQSDDDVDSKRKKYLVTQSKKILKTDHFVGSFARLQSRPGVHACCSGLHKDYPQEDRHWFEKTMKMMFPEKETVPKVFTEVDRKVPLEWHFRVVISRIVDSFWLKHSSDGILDVSAVLGSADIADNADWKINMSTPITLKDLEAFVEVKRIAGMEFSASDTSASHSPLKKPREKKRKARDGEKKIKPSAVVKNLVDDIKNSGENDQKPAATKSKKKKDNWHQEQRRK